MGFILSRYARKKNSEEVLQHLQKDIESIEKKLNNATARQKVIVGKLVIYSVVLYFLIAIITYFYLYPVTWKGKILYSLPLIGLPVLLFYARQFVSWLYKRDITKCKDKLSDLLVKKKKILEDVMNTETYKKAKEILDKYAPEQTKNESPTLKTPLIQPKTPVQMTGQKPPNSQLRRTPSTPQTAMMIQRQQAPRMLVRPIFAQDRSYFDKLVEYLIGDGPNNRYALICFNCASHNGLAQKEEFDYLAYKCVYCGYPNRSRKVRPSVPRTSNFDVSPRRLTFPSESSSLPALQMESANSSDDVQKPCIEIEEIIDEPPQKSDEEIVNHEEPEVISEQNDGSDNDNNSQGRQEKSDSEIEKEGKSNLSLTEEAAIVS